MSTRTGTTALLLASVLLLAALSATADRGRPSAKAGFKKIISIAAAGEEAPVAEILPEELVKGRRDWEPEDLAAWREGFSVELARAKLLSVSQGVDLAFVRYRGRSRDREKVVRLRLAKAGWVVDCPQSYLVKGPFLDTARGSGPARLELAARQKNGPYEGSAFSFAHVTKDPDKCKNRMDLWFCKHGDLHAVGDDRIATVGPRQPLRKVEELDAEWEWKRWAEPVRGVTYVVQCRRSDHRDFYVKLTVVEVSERSLVATWDLLAAGPGAPTTIHEAVPLVSNDGADGYAGMCGGKQ